MAAESADLASEERQAADRPEAVWVPVHHSSMWESLASVVRIMASKPCFSRGCRSAVVRRQEMDRMVSLWGLRPVICF